MMIYSKKPQDFNPKFEVVSCFVGYKGKIILLHRQDYKPEGDSWGVPAGKVEEGEGIVDTIVREVQEETSLELSLAQLFYFGKVFVRYPEYDFVYHIFHTRLDKKQEVIINHQEHKDFSWVSPADALKMPFIRDFRYLYKVVLWNLINKSMSLS